MYSNSNDTTICLPAPKVEREPVLDDREWQSAVADLVEYEKSADPLVTERVVESSSRPAKVVPRVWTVFLSLVLAIVAIVVTQIALAVVLAVWLTAKGVASQDLQERLMEIVGGPAGFIGFGLAAQLAIGLAAVVPAALSRRPLLQRVGLVGAKLPSWGFPVVMIGSLLPASLGILAAVQLARVLPADSSVAALYENLTLGWAIPFVLFISLAPGLMEELLFRGYLQTRLLERWKPGFAIVVSSSLFALFHITPHGIALAFIAGLFLGVLAWRTGSIWPGVLCHAFINGSVNVLRLGVRFGAWSGSLTGVAGIVMTGLVVVCFAVTLWLMIKAPSSSTRRRSPANEFATRMHLGLARA